MDFIQSVIAIFLGGRVKFSAKQSACDASGDSERLNHWCLCGLDGKMGASYTTK